MSKHGLTGGSGRKLPASLLGGIVIFAAALALRLVHLQDFKSTVFFQYPIFDEAFYEESARSIASGNWLGHTVFFMGPLYSYFLGLMYLVFEGSRYAAVAVQCIIGSLTCCLIYVIGKRCFFRTVGLLAGTAACLYGVLIFYGGLLLMETLTVFLNTLCIVLLLRADRTGERVLFLLAGICLGLSALGRASVLAFAPGVIAWNLWRCREWSRKRLSGPLVFCLAVVLVIVPVTLRNYSIEKDIVLVSANGGLNFYIGNGPGATGTFRLLGGPGGAPGEMTGRLSLERKMGRSLTLAEASRLRYGEALAFIKDEPQTFLKNLTWKVRLFWNSYEIPQVEWLEAEREYSRVLRLPLVTSRFMIPIGLLGLIVSARRNRATALLIIYIVAQWLTISAFFVTARYRITILPVICVFAAYGLVRLLEDLRSKRIARPAIWVLLFGVLFWVSDPARLSLNKSELTRWHIVNEALRSSHDERHLKRAEDLLEEVVASFPHEADSRFYYGVVLRRAQKFDAAISQLRQAAAMRPTDPVPLFQIGKTYSLKGDDALAIESFKTALSLAPLYVDAHEHLAFSYVNLGAYEEALEEFRRAVEIDPTDSSLRLNLGVTYARLGMVDEATEQFQHALHYDRANWNARYNLATALVQAGQLHEAQRQLRIILDDDPGNEAARRTLRDLEQGSSD
jgi:tetratricopeptide (TPR) repeat protein